MGYFQPVLIHTAF